MSALSFVLGWVNRMEQDGKTSGRSRLFLFLFLGLPFLLGGGCLALWVGRNRVADAELRARLDERKQAGLPVDQASLAEFYRQRTEVEDAPRWQVVFEQMGTTQFLADAQAMPVLGTGAEIPSPDETWAEQQSVEAFLSKYSVTLNEVLELGKSNDPVQFPVQFGSQDSILEVAQQMRPVARMLVLQRRVCQRNGNAEGQFNAINAMIGCCLALRGESVIVTQMSGAAIHGIAIGELRDAIERDELTTEQLNLLGERLKVFEDFRSPYQAAMQGEVGFMLPRLLNPTLEAEDGPSPPTIPFVSRSRGAVTLLDLFKRANDNAEGASLPEFAKATWQFQIDAEAYFEEAGWLAKLDSMAAVTAVPAMTAFGEVVVRQVMQNRMALIGIAARQFEDARGTLPGSLAELEEQGIGPAIRQTAIGQEFGYRLQEAGAVLWSYDLQGRTRDPQVPSEPPEVTAESDFRTKSWVWRLDATR